MRTIIQVMFFKFLTLSLVLTGAVIHSIGVSPCPIANHNGTIHSGTKNVESRDDCRGWNRYDSIDERARFSMLQLQSSVCFYTCPLNSNWYIKDNVAVHDFEANPSNNVFFYIKPLRTDSLAFLPFVVRTQWAYTHFTKISFSFIAEDRVDFESGYFQIDSGLLAGCSSGKEIKVLMPFQTAFIPGQNINHILFLHGFEITTMPFSSNQRSPYELQLGSSSTNTSGITLVLSVTTITQVNDIYVSFIAFQSTKLDIVYGEYAYDPTNGQGFVHAPLQIIPRNYARIYGITGFIINYNSQSIYFATQWTGHEFHFGLSSSEELVQYLTYEYIFFIGSECQDCPGYPITYNGTCVNACPPNTFLTPENVCLSCGEGRYWNGTACVVSCPKGQYLNPINQQCQCPPTLNWNGERCIPCTAGKVFSEETKSCECQPPFKWNGFACARLPDCSNGKIWDVYTYSCVCPEHQYWAGNQCQDIPTCRDGQRLNAAYRCVCPDGTIWNGQRCSYTSCAPGQVYDGTKCVCPPGRNFNGQICLQCINGQQWIQKTKSCECPSGYNWTGQFCNQTYTCTGNRVWNQTYKQCICPEGEFWNGRSCAIEPICHGGQIWSSKIQECVCPGGMKWNTTNCLICRNGQIWDEPSLSCQCPRGTMWHNDFCRVAQKCDGGMMWNQNIWACECPGTAVWNGNYCISNPCTNGRIWNDTLRSCMCPDGRIWDGQACLPPRIACNNGRMWDQRVYACICPDGTYPAISKCDQIPVCTAGKVYNPLNNQCQCPYGMVFTNGRCGQPSCADGEYWSGFSCVQIQCPPLTYFQDNKCVSSPTSQSSCDIKYYWNGVTCQYFQGSCPYSTQWDGSTCVSNGVCQQGYYQNADGHCVALPQQCIPPSTWTGQGCSASSNSCPEGSYYSGSTCINYVPCQNGHVWDNSLFMCTCPAGQQSNGNRCVSCPGGKEWVAGVGCRCPQGQFDLGSKCSVIDSTRCLSIPDAIWNNGQCSCKEGYSQVGLQCVCYGVVIGDICDRCSHMPNSQWDGYLCKCINGYTEIDKKCISNTAGTSNDDPSSCAVGSYFDSNHRKCVACPDGCLSCVDCYTCVMCRPEFNFHPYSNLCVEKCGDGLRFVDECDDGNNQDGDGCSRDCYVETGYSCKGGSPDAKDVCLTFQTGTVSLSQSGQVRRQTSIILNIRLDYMPKTLIQSADCNNKCFNVLIGQIVSGDQSATSITSQYIPGSTYTFSVTVEFGKEYMGEFQIKLSIDPAIGRKYFGSVSASQSITIAVNPAFLSKVDDARAL